MLLIINFINSIFEESKYCNDVIKKHFNKELGITKEYNQDFENVRDHCLITGKYRGSAHRVSNINLKLNRKIPVVFHNLKNYDSHVTMQEIDKFNPKINIIPNGLEKYMSFTINNKLSLIDSFQFLSSSLDDLIKNLGKDDYKYLSQEFDNNVLDLVLRDLVLWEEFWQPGLSCKYLF